MELCLENAIAVPAVHRVVPIAANWRDVLPEVRVEQRPLWCMIEPECHLQLSKSFLRRSLARGLAKDVCAVEEPIVGLLVEPRQARVIVSPEVLVASACQVRRLPHTVFTDKA